MKFLLILFLLILILTKKDQALSETLNSESVTYFFIQPISVSSQDKDSSDINTVCSPQNLLSFFSELVQMGRIKTFQEILEGLTQDNTHLKNLEVHHPYCNLLQGWNEPKSNLQPQTGNAIFLHNSLTLLKDFQDDLQNDGHTNIMKVNFRHPIEAEKEINEYVSNKTEGKIEDVVKDLSKDTKMVLINHAVFKGEWQETFHPDNTTVEKFFVDENTTVDVPMMHLTGHFNTYRDTDLPCTVVEFPLKNNVSMIIAMAEPGKIHEVEQGLSAKTIQRWKTSLTKRFIQLSIPKFSIDSTIDPKIPLHKLGIKTPFTDTADFSEITHDVGLEVRKVHHRVKITVDEKGTEAAGTTVLEAGPMRPPNQGTKSRKYLRKNKQRPPSDDTQAQSSKKSALDKQGPHPLHSPAPIALDEVLLEMDMKRKLDAEKAPSSIFLPLRFLRYSVVLMGA